MSGRLSVDGVRGVILALEELTRVGPALDLAVQERDRWMRSAQELGEQKAAASTTIKALLSKMDADSPGNFGWTGRFGWLLMEFREQLLRGEQQRMREWVLQNWSDPNGTCPPHVRNALLGAISAIPATTAGG